VSALVTGLSVLGGLLAGGGAVLLVVYTRNRDARGDLRSAVQGEAALKAAADRAQLTAQQALDAVAALHDALDRLDAQGTSGLTLIATRVSVLESKMDVFWKNVALDVSKILHSPHEGWEDLDSLLERFRAETITRAEMADLETQLRDMVEGRWVPADVTRADQVAASLLLRAIEQTRV
jgi:hypothetical protein